MKTPGQAVLNEMDRQGDDQNCTDWDYDKLAAAAIEASPELARFLEERREHDVTLKQYDAAVAREVLLQADLQRLRDRVAELESALDEWMLRGDE